MPASDVYNWAKQVSKPSYSYSEVGAAASDHTHSGYATTSALTSLTSRVTSLEGSVDMAKLVHTEYCDNRLDGDTTVSTFVNADYIIIRPALPVILAAIGSNAASAVNIGADYKIFKGCSGWGIYQWKLTIVVSIKHLKILGPLRLLFLHRVWLYRDPKEKQRLIIIKLNFINNKNISPAK